MRESNETPHTVDKYTTTEYRISPTVTTFEVHVYT